MYFGIENEFQVAEHSTAKFIFSLIVADKEVGPRKYFSCFLPESCDFTLVAIHNFVDLVFLNPAVNQPRFPYFVWCKHAYDAKRLSIYSSQ